MKDKSLDLENGSLRQNLVFYGVEDNNHSETWDQSENKIERNCKTSLGIELTSVRRAHLVGRYNDEKKKRPIIVNFVLYKEKQYIMLNAENFKVQPTAGTRTTQPKLETSASDCGNRQKLKKDR